jgi:hypothetical protein
MPEQHHADRTPPFPGLLVDWGGVLTTSVFDAFAAFGAREGIAPDAVARLFRRPVSSWPAWRRAPWPSGSSSSGSRRCWASRRTA